jgi:hypothetical protein
MIAANFDNLLFLLLVVVAVLFQLLAKIASKKSKGQTKPTSTPPTPLPRAPRESDDDRIRKLLEALGQPPTSRPPPPVVPRTNIPPRPLAPVQSPMSPLSQPRREKPRKRDVVPKEIPVSRLARGGEEITPPNIPGAPTFEIHEGPFPIAPAPVFKAPAEAYAHEMRKVPKREKPRADIASLLASTSGLRDAVILREILGPPRGLRVIDAML